MILHFFRYSSDHLRCPATGGQRAHNNVLPNRSTKSRPKPHRSRQRGVGHASYAVPLAPNSIISFECFPNRAIRLPVNSAITVNNSTGDLTEVRLWLNSKENAMLAWVISISF